MGKTKHGLRSTALAVGVLAAFACATRCCPAQEDCVSITVDPDVEIGRVKPVNGIGQPPLVGWIGTNMFHYLTEAGVPYSRLHDVGGAYGGNRFVDIPNVFRDFDADETKPENYDFAFTDRLLAALVAADVEPYYRLGVTIENAYEIRALRIHPPKDYAKWARICEHVIRHYTEGWANGFHHKISHWEIWNEPDGKALWLGTFQQYLEFYEVASKHLKAKFPHLMIGGYGSSGLFKLVQEKPRPHDDHTMQCFLDFVRFCKERNCPMDFCSIHAYDMPGAWLTPEAVKVYGDFARKTLDEAGFAKTELSMNEWLPRWSDPGSLKQAALIAGLLVGFQHSAWNDAAIYDAKCGMGTYSPFFDPSTRKPRKAYWAFRLFNELRKRGTEVKSTSAASAVQVLAAKGKDDVVALVVNVGDKSLPLDISVPGDWKAENCRIVNESYEGQGIPLPAQIGAYETWLVRFVK